MSYGKNRYKLGIALRKSKSHPFGKGAFKEEGLSATRLVEKAEKEGYSDKKIAAKAQALSNISHNPKAEETAEIARHRAHKKKEFKEDRALAIA